MMEPGVLDDPLHQELVYIAVSTANSCKLPLHTAAAPPGSFRRAVAEFLAVVGMARKRIAGEFDAIPGDREFLIG